MAELLAKVDMVAHSIELYEDELRVQLQLAPKFKIPLKDIVDLEFRRAWFFLAGKLTIIFKENDTLQKMYMPFNFLMGDAIEALVSTMIDRMARVYHNKDAIEFLEMAEHDDGMVQCPYCSSVIKQGVIVCPGCGMPKLD
ncbi:hypothetical protein MCP_2114 [Methanocella paludicola SANAE]|uniref:Uncharacterized protein n=1 Tax=Methanocella paludicola (strain DSM 17711 / JCM 13418 / NBRC 101707 / SANAE) TaxID=304371 RepID=D1Z0G4_METPS|nr:zinc ribbon domain-containing protein [Methanocella paludicola]BAI62186.1 hypothetical protein MCP_2114 [Methanocella paludicola SANAE]